LRAAWDKRIILSQCSKLEQYSQRGIFITPDEPTDVRRKNTFDRLKRRAERHDPRGAVNNGILSIDDITVFGCRTVIHTTQMGDFKSISVACYKCRGFNALNGSFVKSLLAKATVIVARTLAF
jgi:hypothetical protein